MTEFERRLRAALHDVAEPVPAGLLEAIVRRHRQHRLRMGAGVLAAVTAATLAVPSVTAMLRTESTHPPAGRTAESPSRWPGAAAGTVLSGCSGANIGSVGRHWRSVAQHEIGPVWLIDGGHSAAGRRSSGQPSSAIQLYVAIVVVSGVRPGSVVVLRVPAAHRHDLRFLYGPKDYLSPGRRYTMRSGEKGVTFEECRPDQGVVRSPATNYYGGYLVRGARCVPVQVWVHGRGHPATIRLGACPAR